MVPVVLLPGFRGDAREMAPLAEVLWDRPVFCFDLPPGAPGDAAARLRPTIDREVGPTYDLVTGSYGGLVARGLDMRSWATVATFPDRSHLRWSVSATRALLGMLPDALVERGYARRLRARLREDKVPDEIGDVLGGLPAGVLRERLDGVISGALAPLPRVPTLWILGDDDPEARYTDADVLAACPWARVARVPGGHRPYASHPGAVAAVLRLWWAERAVAPAGSLS